MYVCVGVCVTIQYNSVQQQRFGQLQRWRRWERGKRCQSRRQKSELGDDDGEAETVGGSAAREREVPEERVEREAEGVATGEEE